MEEEEEEEEDDSLHWLIGMLPISRSGLVEENAVEVFHYYGIH